MQTRRQAVRPLMPPRQPKALQLYKAVWHLRPVLVVAV
jgi:hypothetical protein